MLSCAVAAWAALSLCGGGKLQSGKQRNTTQPARVAGGARNQNKSTAFNQDPSEKSRAAPHPPLLPWCVVEVCGMGRETASSRKLRMGRGKEVVPLNLLNCDLGSYIRISSNNFMEKLYRQNKRSQ